MVLSISLYIIFDCINSCFYVLRYNTDVGSDVSMLSFDESKPLLVYGLGE